MLHIKYKNILTTAQERDVTRSLCRQLLRHTASGVILLCKCKVYEAIYIKPLPYIFFVSSIQHIKCILVVRYIQLESNRYCILWFNCFAICFIYQEHKLRLLGTKLHYVICVLSGSAAHFISISQNREVWQQGTIQKACFKLLCNFYLKLFSFHDEFREISYTYLDINIYVLRCHHIRTYISSYTYLDVIIHVLTCHHIRT